MFLIFAQGVGIYSGILLYFSVEGFLRREIDPSCMITLV